MNHSKGSTVSASGDADHDDEELYLGAWWGFPPLRNALAAGVALAATYMLARADVLPGTVTIGLYAVVAIFAARHWGEEALESISEFRVDIDVLMFAATIGSAALGLWEEAAFLAFLYAGAEGLEEYTYDRTRGAIRALLDLAPKEASVLRAGNEVTVPADDLVPGDVMVVRPGESLATDGVIRSGATSIDEAAVTGESIPVEKVPGDDVFAGTVNLTGTVEVAVTRAFADNTLSQIIHLVEEAQEDKTETQQLIDRFGKYYSPAVLVSAFALGLVPILFGGDPAVWIRRGITLAVAGAPCALVMSTPVAVASAIGSAGKEGVLIKGGIHLESLAKVRVLAIDKTGTLTRGEPEITDLIPIGDATPDHVLRLAAAVESSSEHPLGKAIVRRAREDGVPVDRAEGFEALTGAGARATVDGTVIYVGNMALFAEKGVPIKAVSTLVEQLQEQGKTVILVGDEGAIVGIVALRDEFRPETPETIRVLRELDIDDVVMLTGDNQRTAAAIADGIGIAHVRAGLKPADKAAAIVELQDTFGPVAMVGDGINDAPALATATVGIAMGTAGTDAAIEAADVALMGDDLRTVPYAIALGRKANTIARQNVVFSIILLSILVPAAVLGAVSIAAAVVIHEGSEILAVLNGLRARRSRAQLGI
ncbi:MAG: cation-translocating P-type ATPase [Actinobacteria bacterium]|nr:cation-translocating P-type ATPase [Actinomycetota bacterium]